MPRVKLYCGNAMAVPPGYDERGNRFQCMKKGFGSCMASGQQGSKVGQRQVQGIINPNRPKIYCGTDLILPDGYTRFGNNPECLRKGFGSCLYSPPKPYIPIPDPWCEQFYQDFKDDEFTRDLWLQITATLNDEEWASVQEYLKLVEMNNSPGVFKIRKRR
jgi:hypothetical protein